MKEREREPRVEKIKLEKSKTASFQTLNDALVFGNLNVDSSREF